MKPCPECGRTFAALCSTVDGLRAENAELRIAAARRSDAPPIAARRAPSPSVKARESRLELAAAKERIAELERANADLHAAVAAERSRAELHRQRAEALEGSVRRAWRTTLPAPSGRRTSP